MWKKNTEGHNVIQRSYSSCSDVDRNRSCSDCESQAGETHNNDVDIGGSIGNGVCLRAFVEKWARNASVSIYFPTDTINIADEFSFVVLWSKRRMISRLLMKWLKHTNPFHFRCLHNSQTPFCYQLAFWGFDDWANTNQQTVWLTSSTQEYCLLLLLSNKSEPS